MTILCLMTSVVKLLFLRIIKARALRRTSFLFFCAVLFSVLSCAPAPSPQVKITGPTMGTSYHVTVVADGVDGDALKAQIDAVLLKINQQMSTYDPESELMHFNNSAPGKSFRLSPELAFVLSESQRINALTHGAFDVTVGPLVNRWGFGPEEEGVIPDAEELATIMQNVGAQWLRISDDGRQAVRQRPIYIDLSAIAKGFGVDQVAELLRDNGYANYLVEIGGELRVEGHNALGLPWRIAIERPSLAPGSVQAAIGLLNRSVATSGSYRNFRDVDGKRYSHTIDPTTGAPVTHNLVSVTVIADTCAEADAFATGFSVMGPEASLDYAESNDMAIFLLAEIDGRVVERWSSAFNQYIDK
ncbi:FAD:protein FMN transferase [Simiduia curdlanivorans]|uniref:FAD:protein FMN transferase n=1 Tax=Simiduia curdlanivorans TaxID=1492769 RepID=A0ABV8V8T6_9GAMM|nr:FAD:protein FMN transferase [Simiduia curdlanivorans]MDN3639584.1 FAD:protein FMN transferase [Simiduia curdlanivorans]